MKSQKITVAEIRTVTSDGRIIAVKSDEAVLEQQTHNSPVTYTRDKRLIPVKELYTENAEEQNFLWGDFIPTGSIVTLCGPSDGGKTMLARQICIAIANGDTQLLSFSLNAKFGKAIYVSTEDSKRDWVLKMKKVGLNDEEKLLVGENMLIVTEYEGLVQMLKSELEYNPVDLVVIDVLPDVFTGDLNSTSNFRAFVKPYKVFAEKHGTSFLFIHHLSKKGESNGSPNKQNVLGAMGIESSMRSVIELRKDPNDGNIKLISITKGNYVSEAVKKKVHKIKQGENFMYESLGTNDTQFVKVKQDIKQAVIELLKKGLTGREITKTLVDEGYKIGKTTVAILIKEIKSDTLLETNSEILKKEQDENN